MSTHDTRSLATSKPPRFPIETALKHSTSLFLLSRVPDKLTNLAIGRLGNGTLSLRDALGILMLTASSDAHPLSRSAACSLLSRVKVNMESSGVTLGVEEKKVLLAFAQEIVKSLRPNLEKKATILLRIDPVLHSGISDVVHQALSSAPTTAEKIRIALLGIFHPKSAIECAVFLSSLVSITSEGERIVLSPGAASLTTALRLIERVSPHQHSAVLTVITPDVVHKLSRMLEF
jgi:hypothetical protein